MITETSNQNKEFSYCRKYMKLEAVSHWTGKNWQSLISVYAALFDNSFIASFDVKLLFTNITLEKTIDIMTNVKNLINKNLYIFYACSQGILFCIRWNTLLTDGPGIEELPIGVLHWPMHFCATMNASGCNSSHNYIEGMLTTRL